MADGAHSRRDIDVSGADAQEQLPQTGLSSSGKSKKPKKQKKPWDKKSKILLTIGIVLLVIAGGLGGNILYGYLSAQATYDEAQKASGLDMSDLNDVINGNKGLLDLNVDWDALRAINPDIIGWVYVGGTDISYPIVQGTDNDYYLHHSFDGSASSSGAIFLDYENSRDFSDGNNVLYGHNMLNGSMFAQITKFKDQEFLNQNYKILILTPNYGFLLSPAFTYVCDGADQLRQVKFNSQQDLQTYIGELMKVAVTESIVDTTKIDKLFSLVTCSYEAYDVRTVLCCVQTQAVTFPKEGQ